MMIPGKEREFKTKWKSTLILANKMTSDRCIGIFGLSCELGDVESDPTNIAEFESLCATAKIAPNMAAMGCESYWKMSEGFDTYIVKSVRSTLEKIDLNPSDIDRIVFSASDNNLRWFKRDTVGEIIRQLELKNALPGVVSLQQCASSLVALDTAKRLVTDGAANNVLVVCFDFVEQDEERITSFALFGDAVVSFVVKESNLERYISGHGGNGQCVVGNYAIAVDRQGLIGKDDFTSRKSAAQNVYGQLFTDAEIGMDRIEYFISTNTYRPVATISASISGIERSKLYIETLPINAHCGICDWALNLNHFLENKECKIGQQLALQATAPGFFACTLIEL